VAGIASHRGGQAYAMKAVVWKRLIDGRSYGIWYGRALYGR